DHVVDVQLEVLALPHVPHAVDAQPAERTHDRLALRVEDLGLEHDVDDHAGHGFLLRDAVRPPYPPCSVVVTTQPCWRMAAIARPTLSNSSSRVFAEALTMSVGWNSPSSIMVRTIGIVTASTIGVIRI